MKVVIPAKTNSERVPNKNFRPFFKGLSLFDITAQQLADSWSEPRTNIYVSSDAESVRAEADKYGFSFILREERLARNDTPMSEVITGIIGQVPGHDDIAWCQVVDPLFSDYSGAFAAWTRARREGHDSLMVVKPWCQFLVDAHGRPINFHYGEWHCSSQELAKTYQITFSLQIITREAAMRCRYYIGTKPVFYMPDSQTIKISTEEDFAVAQILYGRCHVEE